jgi:formate dehydrogenase subunit delta
VSGSERAGGTGAAAGTDAGHGEAGHGEAGAGTGAAHGNAEHLVQMANDIGNFFRSEPERAEGIAGIADHIAKFWTPRMQRKLLDHLHQHGEAGLDELPREAVKLLASRSPGAHPHEPPGGDAG